MTTIDKAKLYLVRAGPGDPDLLTVKANKLLNKCDALIYDSLIPKEFPNIHLVPVVNFFVGNRHGQYSFTQDQIKKNLVELANDHSCIVSLTGGDPFLFGRGAEGTEMVNSRWTMVCFFSLLVSYFSTGQIIPGIF